MPDSPPTYRIARWSEVFEVNRTKEIKHLSWFAFPIDLSSTGYCRMADPPSKAAKRYGVWAGLLCVAAGCDPRGALITHSGRPHGPESIARILRFRRADVEEAWSHFVNTGWLERCDGGAGIPQEGAALSQEPALDDREKMTEKRGREKRGEKRKKSTSPPPPKPAGNSQAAEGGDARPGEGAKRPCSQCTDGAIYENGLIARCCSCPRGRSRAKALRAAMRAEGHEAAAKASRGPEEPRESSTSKPPRTFERGPDDATIVDPDTGRELPPRGRNS